MLNLFSNYLEIIQVRQREYCRLQFNNESNRLFTYYQSGLSSTDSSRMVAHVSFPIRKVSSLNVLFFSNRKNNDNHRFNSQQERGVNSIVWTLIIAVTYSRSPSTHIHWSIDDIIKTHSNTTNRMFPVATETKRFTWRLSRVFIQFTSSHTDVDLTSMMNTCNIQGVDYD